jgi:hypothetical protein
MSPASVTMGPAGLACRFAVWFAMREVCMIKLKGSDIANNLLHCCELVTAILLSAAVGQDGGRAEGCDRDAGLRVYR